MSARRWRLSEPAAEAAIGAACRALHLPTVRAEAGPLADAAAKERLTHRAYLAEVLSAEVDERDSRRRARRLIEARFPRIKRLEDFDLTVAPGVNPATLAALAKGAWIDAGEPVVSDRRLRHRQKPPAHRPRASPPAKPGRRVRYVTCAQLVNELAEAADERILSKVVGRYGRLDLLLVDELGYVSVDPRGAELLFQVLTEREERASVAVASNHPFSKAHRFGRRCARWGLKYTGSSVGRGEASRVDVIGEVVNEAFGVHAERLAGDFDVEGDDEIDDARRSKTSGGCLGGVEHVAEVSGGGRRGSGFGLGGDNHVRVGGAQRGSLGEATL